MNANPVSSAKVNHTLPSYAGTFGTAVVIVSLAILFAASIIAYLVARHAHPDLPQAATPVGLWVSTALLIILSLTAHAAVGAARQDNQSALRTTVIIWSVLAVGFLVAQTANWITWAPPLFDRPPTGAESDSLSFYKMTFYVLTGLHAAHVVGGLIPLAFVWRNTMAGRYTPQTFHPVRNCALYWHFLDVVWIVMFLAIFVIG